MKILRFAAMLLLICSSILLSGCINAGGPTAVGGWAIECQNKNLHATIKGRVLSGNNGIASAGIKENIYLFNASCNTIYFGEFFLNAGWIQQIRNEH